MFGFLRSLHDKVLQGLTLQSLCSISMHIQLQASAISNVCFSSLQCFDLVSIWSDNSAEKSMLYFCAKVLGERVFGACLRSGAASMGHLTAVSVLLHATLLLRCRSNLTIPHVPCNRKCSFSHCAEHGNRELRFTVPLCEPHPAHRIGSAVPGLSRVCFRTSVKSLHLLPCQIKRLLVRCSPLAVQGHG
jgi:hypothetical protein